MTRRHHEARSAGSRSLRPSAFLPSREPGSTTPGDPPQAPARGARAPGGRRRWRSRARRSGCPSWRPTRSGPRRRPGAERGHRRGHEKDRAELVDHHDPPAKVAAAPAATAVTGLGDRHLPRDEEEGAPDHVRRPGEAILDARAQAFDERVDKEDGEDEGPDEQRCGAQPLEPAQVPAPTNASGGQPAPRRRRPHAARSRPAAARRRRRSRRRRRRSGRSSCWSSPRRRRAPAPPRGRTAKPPITNAARRDPVDADRRRRAVAGAASTWVTSPASETRSTGAPAGARARSRSRVPPCGRRQRTRVVNGPAPSPPGPPHPSGESTELEGGAEISWSRARSRAAAGSRPSRRGRHRSRGP